MVASFVGNCSPVNRSTAILVRRARHLRGDIGDELNNRAAQESARVASFPVCEQHTILENGSPVQLHHHLVSILILFDVAHDDPLIPTKVGNFAQHHWN